jgi:MFS family permease
METESPHTPAVPEAKTPSGEPVASAEGWLTRTFLALQNRNFRLFFIGQGISLIGTWMRMTAQGWLVYELTGSKLLLGTVSALGLAPLLLFSTIGGTIADRMSKRKLLMISQGAMMIVSLTIAILVFSRRIQVWHLMVGATLIGTAFAVDLPTRQSFFVEMVGRKALLNAIALNSAMFNAARVIGPAVAGVIMATVGIAPVFLMDSLSFVAVLVSLALIRTRPVEYPVHHQGPWQDLIDGFRYVMRTRRVRILLLLLGLTGVFGWSYVALLPAFAQDILRLDEAGYGLLLSANGAGALAGALFVASRGEKRDSRKQVFGGLWLFGVTLIAFALMRTPLAAGAFVALSGGGLIMFLSTANTLIQLGVPDELRGRVMGVWGLVFGGSLPLGSFLIGAAAEETGVVIAMVAGAVICLGASVIVFLRLPPRPASGGAGR